MSAKLIYCYDPMCSWCWGFSPVWNKLQEALSPMLTQGTLSIEFMLGGLAVDSDKPMAEDMQHKLQSIWKQIEYELGTQFNYDFWVYCQPRRSTYPACRACMVARRESLEQAMLKQIQSAYYLEAKNPSDINTLSECARIIGLDPSNFLESMIQIKHSQAIEKEILNARQLGIYSFPSLVLIINERAIPIALNYQQITPMLNDITLALQ